MFSFGWRESCGAVPEEEEEEEAARLAAAAR